MKLTRRLFLAAPAALLPAPGWGQMLPLDADSALLQAPAGDAAVLLPGLRAHMVLASRLGGLPLLAAAFGVARDGGTLDLLAIAGGAPFRVQGLELWRWKAADGTELATRLSISSDGSALRLARDAARPISATRWARESWADTLQWADGALTERPVRAPQPETWQARLAAIRHRIAPMLAPAPAFVPDAAIAAMDLRGAPPPG